MIATDSFLNQGIIKYHIAKELIGFFEESLPQKLGEILKDQIEELDAFTEFKDLTPDPKPNYNYIQSMAECSWKNEKVYLSIGVEWNGETNNNIVFYAGLLNETKASYHSLSVNKFKSDSTDEIKLCEGKDGEYLYLPLNDRSSLNDFKKLLKALNSACKGNSCHVIEKLF